MLAIGDVINSYLPYFHYHLWQILGPRCLIPYQLHEFIKEVYIFVVTHVATNVFRNLTQSIL